MLQHSRALACTTYINNFLHLTDASRRERRNKVLGTLNSTLADHWAWGHEVGMQLSVVPTGGIFRRDSRCTRARLSVRMKVRCPAPNLFCSSSGSVQQVYLRALAGTVEENS